MKEDSTIKELVENNGFTIDNGVINLFWVNGWSDRTFRLNRALLEYALDDYTTVGPASSKLTSFTVSKGDETYRVEYSLDSGD